MYKRQVLHHFAQRQQQLVERLGRPPGADAHCAGDVDVGMEDGRHPLQLWLLQRVLGVKVDRHVVLFAEDRLVGGANTFYTLAGVADQVLFRRVTLGANDMDEICLLYTSRCV